MATSVLLVPEPTVPATVLALVPFAPEVRSDLAAHAGVMFGNAVEVDLMRAEALHPGAGSALSSYWGRSRALWDALAAGGRPPADAVLVRRTLQVARQTDTKAERHDLAEELFVLSGHPQLAAACAVLDSNPDWRALARLGQVERSSDRSTVTVTVTGQHLPDCLGGPRARNEVARHITLEASHAAWRDRRIRRLMSLTVVADEVWPAPVN